MPYESPSMEITNFDINTAAEPASRPITPDLDEL